MSWQKCYAKHRIKFQWPKTNKNLLFSQLLDKLLSLVDQLVDFSLQNIWNLKMQIVELLEII